MAWYEFVGREHDDFWSKIVTRFVAAVTWFVDKVSCTLGGTQGIVTRFRKSWYDLAYVWLLYKRISSVFWRELGERETWDYKWGNFLQWGSLWFGNIVITLDSEISTLEVSKSFLLWFSLRIHWECGWLEKWVEIRSSSLWTFKLISCNPFISLSS